MLLYLDTGNVDEVTRWVATGVVEGVTTNPSLIAKEGRDFTAVITGIVAAFDAAGKKGFTVSAEVTGMAADDMVAEARQLSNLDPHIVVKVPLTVDGITAIRRLSDDGIRTNATLCFSLNQALLAARAGAFLVSPFLGRLDDVGEDGLALLRDIRAAYDRHHLPTKILAASIRDAEHVRGAALAGADLATVPPRVFATLFDHPLTTKGLERFRADWASFRERSPETVGRETK